MTTTGSVSSASRATSSASRSSGSAEEIRAFITDNYDIDFPVFAKVDVNGDNAAELYQWLKSEQPGEGESSDITWNFEKFLVNAAGDVVARFSPGSRPKRSPSSWASCWVAAVGIPS